MLRKGFTIVELTIVLVVIGIILAMAVQGAGLVRSAKMRNEMAKLNKFEAAVMTGYSKTGYLPEDMVTVDIFKAINPAYYIDQGLLTKEDFIIKMSEADYGNINEWHLVRCTSKYDNTNQSYYFAHDVNGAGVCAIGNSPSTSLEVPFICSIEVMKDDEDLTTGAARNFGNAGHEAWLHGSNIDFKDCFKKEFMDAVFKHTYQVM